MDSKIFVFLGLIGVAIVLLVIDVSVSTTVLGPNLKLLILVFVMFFDALALSSRFYTYLMWPFFVQHRRGIVLSNEDPYWLSSSSDTIMHKEGENFNATVYVKIPLYRSATEMSNDEKMEFTRQVSRLVGLSTDPVRFTTQMHVMNKDEYIQILRDTISKCEDEENNLIVAEAPKHQIERVRGKLSMWRNMLDNVSKSISLELIIYATVSASGSKEYEAASIAQQRARELMSGVSAILGVAPSIVTGDLLLKFVEPEFLIPYSTVSEQITKNIREQVVS